MYSWMTSGDASQSAPPFVPALSSKRQSSHANLRGRSPRGGCHRRGVDGSRNRSAQDVQDNRASTPIHSSAVALLRIDVGTLRTHGQEAWFQVASMRSTAVAKLPAGAATLFDAVLRQFWPERGHNLATAGLPLRIGGRPAEQILLELGIFIQHRCSDSAMPPSQRTFGRTVAPARTFALCAVAPLLLNALHYASSDR